MQRLEVSCAARYIYIYIYMWLGAKGLTSTVSEMSWQNFVQC